MFQLASLCLLLAAAAKVDITPQSSQWLMGYNARVENALTVLAALESVLTHQGFAVPARAGVESARAYARQAIQTAAPAT